MAKFDSSLLVTGVRPARRRASVGSWLAVIAGLAVAVLVGAGLHR